MTPRTQPARPAPDPFRQTGTALLAAALAETATGVVLGNGGLWPDGPEPWLLLGAAVFTSAGGWVGTALATGCAAAAGPWAAAWVAAIALLTHLHRVLPGRGLVGATGMALARTGTLALGIACGAGGPAAVQPGGTLLLVALYASFTFSALRLAWLAMSERPTRSRQPIAILTASSWALVAVPFVPLVPGSHIFARLLSLIVAVNGGLGLFHLVRRKREWDAPAITTAATAAMRGMLLFLMAAVVLPWTTTGLAVWSLILVGVWTTRLVYRTPDLLTDEIEPPDAMPAAPELQAGLDLLQQIVDAPAPDPAVEAELAAIRQELAEVNAKLAEALRAGAADAARAENLERRIQKLLGVVHRTEDELQRATVARTGDAGVRSIYREVQGLTTTDEDYGHKAELLGAIFEANLELQREVAARRGAPA